MLNRWSKILRLLLIGFLFMSCTFAQEVIPDFKEDSVTVLNEELRKLRNDISTLNTSISNITTTLENTTYTKKYIRDLTAASGDAAYTGCPFAPKGIFVMASLGSSVSVGMVSSASGIGTNEFMTALYSNAGTTSWIAADNRVADFHTTPSDYQSANTKTFDSAGVTLTWTKVGSPTGTLIIAITYYK